MIEQSNVECIYKTAAILASSLGPCGMDKLLVDEKGDIMVTNDGATILAHLPITHPANKLLLNLAQTQEQNVGDGTTTTVLLASSLLQQATTLLRSGVHPTIIIQEYKNALELAKQTLQRISVNIRGSANEQILLHKVAQTAISSKVLGRYCSFFSELAVSAVQSLSAPSFHKIKIVTRTGTSMANSRLIRSGMQLRPRNRPSLLYGIPKQHKDGTILVTSVDLNTGQSAGQVMGTSVPSVAGHDYSRWANASAELERNRLLEMAQTIASLHVRVAAVLSPISPVVERFLVEHGVLPLTVSTVNELENIATCTDCTVASFLSSEVKVGKFKSVDIITSRDVYSDSDIVYIEGTGQEMCTVELVAPTDGLVAECERSFVDMIRALLTAVDEPLVVGGGGCVPIELSIRLKELLPSRPDPYNTVCMNAFSEALMVIPQTLVINAGYDAVQLTQRCVELHKQGLTWHAVDLDSGQPADMLELGIIEPVAVFREGLAHAVAMVELVLRTDKNIVATKRQELV